MALSNPTHFFAQLCYQTDPGSNVALLAKGAPIKVYAVTDVNHTTPLTIYRTANGEVYSTYATNIHGMAPDFVLNGGHEEVQWVYGNLSGRLYAREGVRGPAGLPGPEAVPADEAVAAYFETPASETRIVTDDLYQGRHQLDEDLAGAIRNPTTLTAAAMAGMIRMPEIFREDKYAGSPGVQQVIPGHINATDTQTTHPSVVYIPGGWNGYKYWMAHTPYPGSDAAHEDPNIVASQDGNKWVVPAGLVNPLDNLNNDPDYNSDPELVLGPDNRLYCYWRSLILSEPGSEERIYMRSSADGITWTPKVLVMQTAMSARRLLSPAIQYHAGVWHLWAVDLAQVPNRVVHATAAQPQGPFSTPVNCTVTSVMAGKEPWHIEVRRVNNKWVGLLNDRRTDTGAMTNELQFIVSDDGLNFKATPRSVIPRETATTHTALYRATMVPAIGADGRFGFDVWYGAVDQRPSPSVWRVFRTHISEAYDQNARLAALEAATQPTDWQLVTIQPGFAKQSVDPKVRKIGPIVYFVGGWNNTGIGANATHNVGILPVGFRPSDWRYGTLGTTSPNQPAQCIIKTDGMVQIKTGNSVPSYFMFDLVQFSID